MEPRKRREHYSGKYPKKFSEKYKELNPEKYSYIAEHVISKGNTPAGTHIPIMVDEILEILNISPGENGCDCTFGYGGHSRHMLEALDGSGHLVCLDADPIESAKSKERLNKLGFGDDIFSVETINFRNIDLIAEKYGKFDFLMADLGVSSMQIDNPDRGFSYKTDGPLDLRLDPTSGITASERLAELDEYELEGLFLENSDEPYSREIAKAITAFKKTGDSIDTTLKLRTVIEKALQRPLRGVSEKEKKEIIKKSCARCFQALRIDVNQEFQVLYELMEKLPHVMNPGGRIAVLTFHSGEDRLVKKAFRQYFKEGLYQSISPEIIRPSARECRRNPRARSTKMRWAVR